MRLNIAARAGLVAAFVVAVCLCLAVGRAFANDRATYDLIPEQTYISGVDVSGMTREQATQALQSYVAQHSASMQVTLVDPDTQATYPITLSSYVTCDVDAAVEQAVGLRHAQSALSRIIDDATDAEPVRTDIDLAYTTDTSEVRPQVEALAAAVNTQPTDATRTFNDDNTVTVVPETYGVSLDVDATVAAVEDALDTAASQADRVDQLAATPVSAQLVTTPVAPAVTADMFPYGVIIDYAQFMLYVFDGEQMIYSVQIGYGRGWEDGVNYSSPEGMHYIEYFDPAPTWTNPDPTGWGKDYKAFYAGGEEGNPLGSRAMKINDAPMVFIHGVTDPNCIGNRLSHGCINVWDSDVIQLYQLLYDDAVAKGSSSVGGSGEPVYVYFHNYPG